MEKALRPAAEGRINIEKVLEFLDNVHTPPSKGTITQREINSEKKERLKNNPAGRRGCAKGCTNSAVSRRATRTVRHRPEKCGFCGGKKLTVVRITSKNVMDIPFIPKMEVANHIVDECKCDECGNVTVPQTGLLKGTPLGPNLLKILTGMWESKVACQDIANMFSGLFGIEGCAKSTIQHGWDSVADRMEPEAGAIKGEMRFKDTPVNIDETLYSIRGKAGQAWMATDKDAAVVEMTGSRGAAVLKEHFP